MDPLSFLKSILKAWEPIQTATLRLQPGQMITGKIIRLYPNQMAELQIGSFKLMAKLEAQVAVNQQYWFQVQQGEGRVRLKLIKKPTELLSADSRIEKDNATSLNNGTEGSIEQLVDQIPLPIGSAVSDLTIQWNGRKKENGKIDANDCRILFYLELKNIGELFVDLRIQNRKLSITMINEKIAQNFIEEPQIAILKENLQQLNYHLSSIKFEQPSGEKPLKSILKKGPKKIKSEGYPEVDLRI